MGFDVQQLVRQHLSSAAGYNTMHELNGIIEGQNITNLANILDAAERQINLAEHVLETGLSEIVRDNQNNVVEILPEDADNYINEAARLFAATLLLYQYRDGIDELSHELQSLLRAVSARAPQFSEGVLSYLEEQTANIQAQRAQVIDDVLADNEPEEGLIDPDEVNADLEPEDDDLDLAEFILDEDDIDEDDMYDIDELDSFDDSYRLLLRDPRSFNLDSDKFFFLDSSVDEDEVGEAEELDLKERLFIGYTDQEIADYITNTRQANISLSPAAAIITLSANSEDIPLDVINYEHVKLKPIIGTGKSDIEKGMGYLDGLISREENLLNDDLETITKKVLFLQTLRDDINFFASDTIIKVGDHNIVITDEAADGLQHLMGMLNTITIILHIIASYSNKYKFLLKYFDKSFERQEFIDNIMYDIIMVNLLTNSEVNKFLNKHLDGDSKTYDKIKEEAVKYQSIREYNSRNKIDNTGDFRNKYYYRKW
jgi:hypothetical protein